MSNWLKAESSSGLDCGFDQVEKCDLFPYNFLSHFLTCYRKSGLIEVPLLGPIHHQKKNYSWKSSLNGLNDEKNMGFWIWAMTQTGTNDLQGYRLTQWAHVCSPLIIEHRSNKQTRANSSQMVDILWKVLISQAKWHQSFFPRKSLLNWIR